MMQATEHWFATMDDPRNGVPGLSVNVSGPPSLMVVAQSIVGT